MYLISTEERTWQTVTMYKNDYSFSVVYSLLKMKNKANIFENIFKIPWCFILIVWNVWSGRKNHVSEKLLTWYNDFAFHVGNHIGICWMLMWVRKTVAVKLNKILHKISPCFWKLDDFSKSYDSLSPENYKKKKKKKKKNKFLVPFQVWASPLTLVHKKHLFGALKYEYFWTTCPKAHFEIHLAIREYFLKNFKSCYPA